MMTKLIRTPQDYDEWRVDMAVRLIETPGFDRGGVHAQKTSSPSMITKELTYVNLSIKIPEGYGELADLVRPNLPWAEDHFQERVGGQPLNPPPSNKWWPFAQAGNAQHKKGEVFSHTYPERIWPKYAGIPGKLEPATGYRPHRGIRYAYGDLNDLIEVFKKNPRSRQAYLPIWFPEDITAAGQDERVPCTLGYHFMNDSSGVMNLFYPMRSCDFLRFMPDDIYMAGRLLQHVAQQTDSVIGALHMSISSLHVFTGDTYTLGQMILPPKKEEDEDDWSDYASGVTG